MNTKSFAALLLTTAIAVPASAQEDNLGTLQNMQRTSSVFTMIEQGGATAASLNAIVPFVNVPDGFEASLYAVVPDARSMAVAPQGTVVFVGTRKDKVWSVVDRDRDRVADQVMDFAPSIAFDIPNGPCLSYDFPWLLGQKGATARHAIYGGQWRWLDRKQLGLSGPLRSMINRRLHHRA